MIVVVDYGMGNLGSIVNMVRKVGGRARRSTGPEDLAEADKIILPGVGSFDEGMRNLRAGGYVAPLAARARDGRTPVLGICLGVQLFTRGSEEGAEPGLSWIEADTVRFRPDAGGDRLKVPHMGWNTVRPRRAHPLLPDPDRPRRFYFVHSYHVRCDAPADVLATTRYGVEFASAVARGNIVGTQFHPEKSHRYGMELMRRFVHDGPAGETAPAARPAGADRRTRVIPCLLLKGSGLVKTTRFADPVYLGDCINTVKIFNDKEVDELALLDVTATAKGRGPRLDLLARLANECFMPLSYGGGVRSVEDVRAVLGLGFEKVIVNTRAAEEPAFIRRAADAAGSQSVVVSIDAGRRRKGWEVRTRAGTRATGLEPATFARQMEAAGAGEILLNAIERDGTMEGYDVELIRRVADAVSIPVIACGGAGGLTDFAEAVNAGRASAVAAGSFFVFHGRRRAVLISFPTPEELADAVP